MPGFLNDREALATAMASADIYVSGMPNETFGISVIEAQASGLPVVGVSGGAMPARVPPELGRLGPEGDCAAMALNVQAVWQSDIADTSARARAHVMDKFRWEKTFSDLLNSVYVKARASAAERIRPGKGRTPHGFPSLRKAG